MICPSSVYACVASAYVLECDVKTKSCTYFITNFQGIKIK